jgi:predicted DNA-binding transcriptional regulator YafY
MGSPTAVNVASDRTGEAWFASSICPESDLVAAVEDDVCRDRSRLRKAMMRCDDGEAILNSLVAALNNQESPAAMNDQLSLAANGVELAFTYTKEGGQAAVRRVTALGVMGESIQACDHEDDRVKTFRIDRISNARRI